MGKYDNYSIAAAWMDDPETKRLILEMREELQEEDLAEKYAYYYDNVRKCQEMCEHPDVTDGYCFLCKLTVYKAVFV